MKRPRGGENGGEDDPRDFLRGLTAREERGRVALLRRFGYVRVTLIEGQDDTREALLMLLWIIFRLFLREFELEIREAAEAAADDGQ